MRIKSKPYLVIASLLIVIVIPLSVVVTIYFVDSYYFSHNYTKLSLPAPLESSKNCTGNYLWTPDGKDYSCTANIYNSVAHLDAVFVADLKMAGYTVTQDSITNENGSYGNVVNDGVPGDNQIVYHDGEVMAHNISWNISIGCTESVNNPHNADCTSDFMHN